jgi:hypothetical protein
MVPPITEKRKGLHVLFHSTRPLILVQYIEEPVPWTRVLVFGLLHNASSYGILYNSSFYMHRHTRVVLIAMPVYSYHVLLAFRRLELDKRIIISEIKLYDFSAGKLIGQLLVPVKEKCTKAGVEVLFHAIDPITFAISCELLKSAQASLTIYSFIKRHKNCKLVGELLWNSTIVISIVDGNKVFFSENILESDICCVFVMINSIRLIIIRNIRQGLTTWQRCRLSVRRTDKGHITNHRLGIIIWFSGLSSSQWFGFEVICSSKKSLNPKIDTVRSINIQIDSPIFVSTGRDELMKYQVVMDQHTNILELHRHRPKEKSHVYNVVNVYSRIT